MEWTTVAWVSLGLGIASALVIAADEARRPQRMAVMNVVWPLTALYFSVLALPVYFTLGRRHSKAAMDGMNMDGEQPKLTLASAALGTTHCGAGCALADVLTEFLIAAAGLTLFGSVLVASCVYDFVAAWVLGIVFQYFALKPMRPEMSAGAAVVAAMKADTLSIVAFQVGMYAFMAWSHRALIPGVTAFDPRYWFSMQAAMVCGFVTSLPMNAWLIRAGLKEAM